MKIALATLAAAFAFTTACPIEASAKTRTQRATIAKKKVPTYQRAASVQRNGLCQRDTGTPDSQLDFRNKCDVEEFWNRTLSRDHGRD